jgi:tetratricopeptide (TPR) repeat protein/transglutaminase-like putative cysteine protease
MIVNRRAFPLICALVIPGLLARAQQPAAKPASPSISQSQATTDNSKESSIIQSYRTSIRFENDGTLTRQINGKIRLQSEAGIQEYSVIRFNYSTDSDEMNIEYVRVRKPDGTVIETPRDDFQKMAADITRTAPMYTDLHETHVPVKGLSVGDILEYSVRTHVVKPLIPGQFWLDYTFNKQTLILEEELEVNVPKGRFLNVKSPEVKPAIRDEGDRRIYLWKSANLARKSDEGDDVPTEVPPPPVQISTFRTWDEIGKWWASLEDPRVVPTPEIIAKATALTKDAKTDEEKIRAIYNFASLRFRYIGVSFGLGRYQPHPANDVLNNAYGDCKDKHTLLASLLKAIGLDAYPALINSSRDVDQDLPSPGQFDHVITAVPRGNDLIWLDTTPEIAPFGLILSPLRGRHALLIRTDGTAALVKIPSESPVENLFSFSMAGKLSEDGTMEGQIERYARGDLEILLRAAYRATPQPDWKDLTQRISYGSGFSGQVSDVTASSPESLDTPFHVSYQYVRKNLPDWPQRRLVAFMPNFGLPELKDTDKKRVYPIPLGPPMAMDCKARIQMPKGYTPNLLPAQDIVHDFAEYHSAYSFKDGVWSSEHRLSIKMKELPPERVSEYMEFQKAVAHDVSLYTYFSNGTPNPVAGTTPLFMSPPTNPETATLLQQASAAMQSGNFEEAADLTERATKLSPDYKYGWLMLGNLRLVTRRTDDAIAAFQKAIDSDPKDGSTRRIVALTLMRMKRPAEAIQVWRDLVKLDPQSFEGHSNLGILLLGQKKAGEAIPEMEAGLAINADPVLELQLGQAYCETGQGDKALAAMRKATDANPRPDTWNEAGWYLADNNLHLPDAFRFANLAVTGEEEATSKIDLDKLSMDDLSHMGNLAAFWDTLGWVYYRQGDLLKAEKLIGSAWYLMQSESIGSHLADIYEKEGKKTAAANQRAMVSSLEPTSAFQPPVLLKRRRGVAASTLSASGSAMEEISQMRRIKLGPLSQKTGSAEFFVMIGAGSKVIAVKFIKGDEFLRPLEKSLATAKFKEPIPDDGPTRVVRRGVLVCQSYGLGCDFTVFPLETVRSLD